jgi:hypothetical protein
VQPFRDAISSTERTRSRFFWKFSPWNLGWRRRKSSSGQVLELLEAAGEESSAQRAIWDEADAELAAGREDLVLDVAHPERVLGLQRGDRVHGVRAADRRRRGLAEPEEADLPLLHELGHRPDRLLDWHLRVDAVLVVEVDVIGAEPLERRLAGAADVLGGAVDAEAVAALVADVAELRGEHDLVAPAADGVADEPLVGERAVHVGRVEEVDAEVERAVDRRDRLRIVAAGVEVGHPHAAEAEGGDGEIGTEGTTLHCGGAPERGRG